MGIREQFQDKAKELAARAEAAARGQRDAAPERPSQAGDQVKERARDTFDEPFAK
ncbi:hypothetical protein [Streptomyces sp. G-G2]|uniref:hypothetical protein n=1 Tax=Streptomyces sp. G-G2 TaxID=3046201 RepID=UPI0024B8B75C|nr:hypothetical protein [Streptomyces sp. G-G2]MDJ0380553.1 hypothetical protein [Streptomyces sp. G-G2]